MYECPLKPFSNNKRSGLPIARPMRRFLLSNHRLAFGQHLDSSLTPLMLDQHRRESLSNLDNDLNRGFVRVVLHVSIEFL